MKGIAVAAALAMATAVLPRTAAHARGCLKGAAVGGVAGHFLHHHGVIGAGVGCLVGHHEAAKHAREHTNGQNR